MKVKSRNKIQLWEVETGLRWEFGAETIFQVEDEWSLNPTNSYSYVVWGKHDKKTEFRSPNVDGNYPNDLFEIIE